MRSKPNAFNLVNKTRKLFEPPLDYWGSHPAMPVEDWRDEVAEGATRQGYWEWVAAQMGLIEI